jgi:hypothetical protein
MALLSLFVPLQISIGLILRGRSGRCQGLLDHCHSRKRIFRAIRSILYIKKNPQMPKCAIRGHSWKHMPDRRGYSGQPAAANHQEEVT